ncbi:MAG: hypothetical protein HYU30_03835 [Chloroflexi bacterium]|nr:hypothetical protein [Chloroflexota bacterium]
MAVKITIKETGQTIQGKYAAIDAETVGLFSGIMADKKGGFRGCGKKQVFPSAAVIVAADDPAIELKRR